MKGVGSTMRQTLRGGLRLRGGASLDSEVDGVEDDGVLSEESEDGHRKSGDVEDGEKADTTPTMERSRDVVNFMVVLFVSF